MSGEVKSGNYESLKALYYSGKVKPSLNKMVTELKANSNNIDLTLLACQALVRIKDFEMLSTYADVAIKLDSKNADGYYFKGVALQHAKGKEQEALKNFNEALTIEPENTLYLQDKAATHLSLFTDYHLPITLAEKHRVKGEDCLLKIVSLIEEKEHPSFVEYMTIGDVSTIIKRNVDAKKYYLKAVKAFNDTGAADQDKNIYKDIIKAQKANIKLLEKFTE